MRFSVLFAATSALALTACGETATTVEDPNDPEQIAAATENLARPEPGEYRISAELVEFELPGASEEEQEAMRGIFEMASGQTRTMCMTEEEAEAGYQEFLENLNSGAEGCEFSSFTVDGDQLDATMQCDDGSGATGTMQFAGTITETGQDMTVTMDMENAADGTGMRVVMRNTTERIGECAADAGNG